MGVQALLSHRNGRKHMERENGVNSMASLYINPVNSTSEVASNSQDDPSTSTNASATAKSTSLIKDLSNLSMKTLDAEIRWALKVF